MQGYTKTITPKARILDLHHSDEASVGVAIFAKDSHSDGKNRSMGARRGRTTYFRTVVRVLKKCINAWAICCYFMTYVLIN
ncbi:hypothetical protein ACQJBY_071386 [Aegilops geniculata]